MNDNIESRGPGDTYRHLGCLWNVSPKTIMRLNIRLKGKSNRERCQVVGGGIRGALYG